MKESLERFGPRGWTPDRLPDLSDKSFVITGGNSGIGFEAARLFLARGARVWLLCRSRERAEHAERALRSEVGETAAIEIVELELSSLASVRRAAETVRQGLPEIDGLLLNAGIMMIPRREVTEDGFEKQLAVNHYGHFVLAALLADAVEAAAGRFVSVSSIAHRMGLKRIRFEDIEFERGYRPITAYAQTKLANLMFARELDRRLRAAGRKSRALVCHPGYSATRLQTTGPGAIWGGLMRLSNAIVAQPAERGGWPLALAAADPEAKGGRYYGPTRFRGLSGPVRENAPARHACDAEAAARLWEVSEEKTGVAWSFDTGKTG